MFLHQRLKTLYNEIEIVMLFTLFTSEMQLQFDFVSKLTLFVTFCTSLQYLVESSQLCIRSDFSNEYSCYVRLT